MIEMDVRHNIAGRMELIDTHCHLADDRLAGRIEQVIAEARRACVIGCLCAAGDPSEAVLGAKLAEKYSDVWFMAGVHPHESGSVEGDYLRAIEQFANMQGCLAVGETGLDYHYDYSDRVDQQMVFAEQLGLAAQLEIPVVVHSRDAFDDTLLIIGDSDINPRRVLFHSFTGDEGQVRRALEIGATVSFSGIVTFKNAGDIRKAAKVVPDEQLLIETDAPYLSPEPVRKQKVNTPANVVHVAECLAAVRGTTGEKIAEITTRNARRFFGV